MPTHLEGPGLVTQAVQDYVKAIYMLGLDQAPVTTGALAERLGVSAASATSMMKRLAEMKLATHTPYQGVLLTVVGRKIALEVIRHHRLLELYLREVLGYSLEEVHAEAERLEHVISEEFEDRIDRALGYPTHDPHGDPIPSKSGEMPPHAWRSLADVEPGRCVVVRRVSDQDAGRLVYLRGLGLVPDAELEVLERAPFNGPLRLLVPETDGELHIGLDVARSVFVSPKEETHAG
jgi:DtxR family Mn-dependent transcriptional regulator